MQVKNSSSSFITSHRSIPQFSSILPAPSYCATNRKRILEQTVRIEKTFVRNLGTQAWPAFGIGAFYNPPPPRFRVRDAHSGAKSVRWPG